MRVRAMGWVLWLTLSVALFDVVLGAWLGHTTMIATGGCALGFVAIRAIRPGGPRTADGDAAAALSDAMPVAAAHWLVDANDTAALVEQMLAQGRCALVLRPQIAATLPDDLFARALGAFHETAALVPEGNVTVHDEDDVDNRGQAVHVTPLFIDRYPLTNRAYYEFVAAGGYEQMALWEAAIWPAVLEFVDRTGLPGPRYWRDGCYLPGEGSLPVVGICWYEAAACARWLGRRLPADAEWVKAAAWPIDLGPASDAQRRFPWGETMDRGKANIFGSGPGRIVPVTEYASGVSVGGVYQLIGNVWEWTASSFHPPRLGGELGVSAPLRTIRGGAFDTYFESQASCRFASGDSPLARRHNIGFRCAISLRDLMLSRIAAEAAESPRVDAPPPDPATLQTAELALVTAEVAL